MSEQALFSRIASYCGAQTGGRLGKAEVARVDDNGAQHVFTFETFFIRYKGPVLGEALTLGVYARPRDVVVSQAV